MKGKLIKQEDGYLLIDVNTSNEDRWSVIGSYPFNKDVEKLSLKNCQAIENGYDLNELTELYSGKGIFEDGYDGLLNPHTKMFIETSYIKGFQKALEILGDKKFSEFLDKEKELGISDIKTIERIQWYYNTYFDKSQQTEWDVVVEMDIDNPCPKCGEKDNVHGNYDYSNITRPLINTLCNECGTYFSPIPKLDADGCLILKKIC